MSSYEAFRVNQIVVQTLPARPARELLERLRRLTGAVPEGLPAPGTQSGRRKK